MHGVPADLNLAPFIGCTLDQIALGAHQLQFHFSGPGGVPSRRISVESYSDFRGPNGDILDQALDDDQLPSDREVYRIHRALTHTVTRVAINPPDSITLEFDDGTTLSIWDSNGPLYESFQIEPGGYVI